MKIIKLGTWGRYKYKHFRKGRLRNINIFFYNYDCFNLVAFNIYSKESAIIKKNFINSLNIYYMNTFFDEDTFLNLYYNLYFTIARSKKPNKWKMGGVKGNFSHLVHRLTKSKILISIPNILPLFKQYQLLKTIGSRVVVGTRTSHISVFYVRRDLPTECFMVNLGSLF